MSHHTPFGVKKNLFRKTIDIIFVYLFAQLSDASFLGCKETIFPKGFLLFLFLSYQSKYQFFENEKKFTFVQKNFLQFSEKKKLNFFR